MISSKEGILYRIEVKSTLKRNKSGFYIIQLRSVRSNKTKNVVYPFDNSKIDLLGIYLEDIDKVIIYDSKSIIQKTSMKINI